MACFRLKIIPLFRCRFAWYLNYKSLHNHKYITCLPVSRFHENKSEIQEWAGDRWNAVFIIKPEQGAEWGNTALKDPGLKVKSLLRPAY